VPGLDFCTATREVCSPQFPAEHWRVGPPRRKRQAPCPQGRTRGSRVLAEYDDAPTENAKRATTNEFVVLSAWTRRCPPVRLQLPLNLKALAIAEKVATIDRSLRF
jgi:hypothetical protein